MSTERTSLAFPSLQADPYRPAAATTPGRLHDAVLLVAMLLLPFSLDEDIVVFSFGLPVFALLALYYLARIFSSPTSIAPRLPSILLLAITCLGIMIATSWLAENPLRSLWRVAIHGVGILMLWYFCSQPSRGSAAQDLERYRGLIKILARSGALMGLYYVANIFYQSMDHGLETVLNQRWMGGLASLPWGASNTVAGALLIPFVACLQVLAEPAPKTRARALSARVERVEWIAYALLIASGILAAVSRNAITVMFLVFAIFLLRKATVGVLIAATAVGAFLLLSIDQDVVFSVIDQRVYGQDVQTLNQRLDIWSEYAAYISAAPFSPIGYYNTLFEFGYSGHNFTLTTYVEQSLVGWLAAAALFIMLLARCGALAASPEPNDRVSGRFLFVGLLALAINLHFEDANFTQQYILYWWYFVGLICYRWSIRTSPSVAYQEAA